MTDHTVLDLAPAGGGENRVPLPQFFEGLPGPSEPLTGRNITAVPTGELAESADDIAE